MNSLFSSHALIVSVASLLLTACVGPQIRQEAEGQKLDAYQRVDTVDQGLEIDKSVRGTARFADMQAAEQKAPILLRRARSSWVSSESISVNAEDRLPAEFHRQYVLNFEDAGKGVGLATVAARLTELVGIAVRIQPEVLEIPESSPQPRKTTAYAKSVSFADVQSVNQIRMQWRGSLVDFLNNLTDRLGLSWMYSNNTIVIVRFVTELYEVATFPTGYDYTLSSGAGGKTTGEGISANSALAVVEKGKMEGLRSIIDAIEQMIADVPGSTVIQAEGSGRLIVKTSKHMQTRVRELVRAENEAMLKQVHIQLDIYSVSANKTDQKGVDWSLFYQNVLGNPNTGFSPATLVDSTRTGSVAFKIDSSKFGGSSVVLKALNEIGTDVQYRPISLIALNRQWARKARLSTQGYLSETTPGTSTTPGGVSGLPGLTTDSITTGDQFSALPYVLDNNTILLKMGISLSTLESLFDVTTGSGATLQRVQNPNTSQISDQYTISLKPGEIMAITGLSRQTMSTNNRSLSEHLPFFLGGSQTVETNKEHFVIFVRAVLI